MKRYNSIADITGEDTYRPQNPVNQQNYRKLKGPYALTEELECCCQKANGNLCEQRHRKGWVAELQDGTSTVLGGNCATDKFGAESIISRDIALASNEIARQDEVARLAGLLAERDTNLAQLDVAKRQIVGMKQALIAFHKDVGRTASNVLTEMSRTGGATIQVLGIVPPEHDENGELVRDRRVVTIDVANISGVAVCNAPRIETTLNDIRKIEQAYRIAGSDPERPFKRKEVKELTAALADQQRVMSAVRDWREQSDRFERNDFVCLAFAVADMGERIRLAQFGLKRLNQPSNRDAAKRTIQERESVMRRQYNVKVIRIR